jgi:hypothetical protein
MARGPGGGQRPKAGNPAPCHVIVVTGPGNPSGFPNCNPENPRHTSVVRHRMDAFLKNMEGGGLMELY